jgi:cyclic pyranopterin phosphate synthase
MDERDLSHLDRHGALRMVDVGAKAATHRRARAEGCLIAGQRVMEIVRTGQAPKGDVFAAARLAGIAAAKRTSELIPLCHSIPLSHVVVEFQVEDDRIRIIATVSADARTGVEMEALAAVSTAALTLYDMLKAVSHEMVIADIKLLEKSGGKSDYRRAEDGSPSGVPHSHITADAADKRIRAAVLTVSDRCSAGKMKDSAGPAVAGMLVDQLRAVVEWCGVIPDESDQIAEKLKELADRQLDLIVTVGGTGCGPRDVTPEATRSVVVREVPGLAETMRLKSAQHTPHAALQRGICGIRERSLILNLPGSEKAALENLSAVLAALPHAIALIGNNADGIHPSGGC